MNSTEPESLRTMGRILKLARSLKVVDLAWLIARFTELMAQKEREQAGAGG